MTPPDAPVETLVSCEVCLKEIAREPRIRPSRTFQTVADTIGQ